MKKLILLLLIPIFSLSLESDFLGLWATDKSESENQGIIHIYKDKDGKIKGKLVAFTQPYYKEGELKGKKIMDLQNEDKNLKNRTLVGVDLVHSLSYNSKNNTLEKGYIYNPNDGKTYYCNIKLNSDGSLYIRGSVDALGVFGKTQKWITFSSLVKQLTK